jgi:WD40 repeat protein
MESCSDSSSPEKPVGVETIIFPQHTFTVDSLGTCGCAVSADGALAVATGAGEQQCSVNMWDLRRRPPVRKLLPHPPGLLYYCAVADSSARVAAAAGSVEKGERYVSAIHIWRLPRDDEAFEQPHTLLFPGRRGMNSVMISEDGKELVAAVSVIDGGGEVIRCSASDSGWDVSASPLPNNQQPGAIRASRDLRTLLVSAGADESLSRQNVWVMDSRKGSITGQWETERDTQFAVGADGNHVVISSRNAMLVYRAGRNGIFSRDPCLTIDALSGYSGAGECAVNMGGTLVLAVSSFTLEIKAWDGLSGALVGRFQGHTNCPFSLSVNPDWSVMMTTGFDSTVRVWSLEGELEGTGTPCTRKQYTAPFYYSTKPVGTPHTSPNSVETKIAAQISTTPSATSGLTSGPDTAAVVTTTPISPL